MEVVHSLRTASSALDLSDTRPVRSWARERVGDYDLVAPHGWRALHGGIERLFTVSVLAAHDPARVESYLDDARLAATLHHAHIAQVVEVGGPSRYFVAFQRRCSATAYRSRLRLR